MKPVFIKFKYSRCNPVDIYSKLGIKENSFILDSGDSSKKTARWSFIGMDPFIIFRSKNGRNEVVYNDGKREIIRGESLTILKQLFSRYKMRVNEKLPPFFGGIVGFFSYDYDCHFLFIKTVVAIDKLNNEVWLITADDSKRGRNILEKLRDKIQNSRPKPTALNNNVSINSLRSNYTLSEYKRMIENTKEYIRNGDIYQANLSQRFKASAKGINPFSLYQRLREVNPSPFACFLNFDDVKIISSSPERLVKLSGRTVQTRPIAGTRPRGGNKIGDKKMEDELILNEKERAEHIMLVDLERNDLGRVCEYGSIKIDEFMALEKYSHVIHIVSNIKGRLQKGKDAFDCIRACFPGGTITGVPKVRCMEIIDELEKHRRGPYTGSAGYISWSGDMDFNILIRTFVIENNNLYFHVGGGIVADSTAEKEYEETLHKASALMEAIGANAHQYKR